MSINTIGVNSSLGYAVAQADGTRNGFYTEIPVGTTISMLRIYLTPGFTGSIDNFTDEGPFWINSTPFTSGDSLVITQNGGAPLTTLYFQPDNGGGGPVCFLGHAPVATPTGPKRIDSLTEGDLVLTETGKSVPIQRVKVMRCRPGPTTNPYIIAAGQFGATEELLISPRHKVAVAGGKMVEARDLGLTQKAMKAPFNYYNIELPGWANMRVAGVTVESLAPAKRLVATVDQVKAAIAALPASQKTAETMKTLNRICQKTADGKIVVFGSF